MQRTAYKLCHHQQQRYFTQEVFNAAPENVKQSFSCLFAHHTKIPPNAYSDVTEREDHASEQNANALSSPLTSKGDDSLVTTVSNLFSALEEYTSSLQPKKSAETDMTPRDFQSDNVKAALQMLLLTATDDLCMNALYRRRMEGITTILGTTYADDFFRVWRTWDQWWREAAISLRPESLLAGEDQQIFAQSPIEAYVQRYKAPLLTQSASTSVRRVKDDFLLTSTLLHTEKAVRRDESHLNEKAQRKKALLKDLAIQRMKDSCNQHAIVNHIQDRKTLQKEDDRQVKIDSSIDFDSMAESFLLSCLKSISRNRKHNR
ncbi:histidine kinase [Perkinsela sp. CCAP 1560/4]|nr:histidine kinase [Perkinsela sp. CCAP 1560/4]|eukprot:KNH07777.1 histidine kinase [Perkinsela sp. CCAP 1560/4]